MGWMLAYDRKPVYAAPLLWYGTDPQGPAVSLGRLARVLMSQPQHFAAPLVEFRQAEFTG